MYVGFTIPAIVGMWCIGKPH